ncbi:hypothetical protein AWV80_14985 [Cupriavidus sp. UYMU48A]|nr:hypothetical protein AWV80_14985 [Cupriavidus sp. UYMU48A]
MGGTAGIHQCLDGRQCGRGHRIQLPARLRIGSAWAGPGAKAGNPQRQPHGKQGHSQRGTRRCRRRAHRAANALDQLPVSSLLCQPGTGRFVLREAAQAVERERQRARLTDDAHGKIIRDVLAFFAEATGQPPDRRMEEKQCLDHALQEVDEVIHAPDMREFVG